MQYNTYAWKNNLYDMVFPKQVHLILKMTLTLLSSKNPESINILSVSALEAPGFHITSARVEYWTTISLQTRLNVTKYAQWHTPRDQIFKDQRETFHFQ